VGAAGAVRAEDNKILIPTSLVGPGHDVIEQFALILYVRVGTLVLVILLYSLIVGTFILFFPLDFLKI
jgi:hypothetical protein